MSYRFKTALALACLCFIHQAQAADGSFAATCSDQLSISGSTDALWQCTGDLSLSGINGEAGSLRADNSIKLVASGALTLTNIVLTAPNIELLANSISIAPDAYLMSLIGVSFNTPNPPITVPDSPILFPPVNLDVGVSLSGQVGTVSPGTHPSGNEVFGLDVTISVPEPATWLTLCTGLLAMGWLRRRSS